MTTDAVDSVAEAGSSPRVRPQFRPDIEGLRAVAVGLVLAFHGYSEPFTGGFIGVDVFFVISGFLITSLLLRERLKKGRISILGFYARRVRRILPASALVVVCTVVATYYLLGFIAGNDVADDAKWTAAFAANIHFGLLGTNYLGSQLPPSPLQHMWSLGVEEQFYVAWPGLFLLLVLLVRGARHRWAMGAVLLAVIASSLSWSILQTETNATWAYFSPLTRAWELGLGALIAVGATGLGGLTSRWVAETVAALGMVFIGGSALLFDDTTPFPGSAVALPVVGTGLMIAAGCANECTLVGRMLSLRPMQWVGARSYSLYLWHWPPLIIAAQYLGDELTSLQVTALLAGAVLASALTYRLLENPVRRSRYLASRTGLTLGIGAALIVGQIAIAQTFIATHHGTWNPLQATTITEDS
ncbi:acyltransferase [Mycobacterium sp. OAE908]|uniref:acyltransferase family protein n=1 Tax=Mycobacterium sp. OAE908 TaxID=2817899 RepID=UPI001AE331BB